MGTRARTADHDKGHGFARARRQTPACRPGRGLPRRYDAAPRSWVPAASRINRCSALPVAG